MPKQLHESINPGPVPKKAGSLRARSLRLNDPQGLPAQRVVEAPSRQRHDGDKARNGVLV